MANPPNSVKAKTGENRLAIFFVVVLAAIAGLGPIALGAESPEAIPWFIAEVVAVSIWRLSRLGRSRSAAPSRSFLEYLLATLAAAFSFQIMTLMAVIPAALVLMLLQLINTVGSWLSLGWNLPAWNAAWWTTIVLAVFFVLVGISLAEDKARAQLFPAQPHGRSAFHAMAVSRRAKLLWAVAINLGVVLLVAGWLVFFRGGIGSGFWLFVMLYITGCATQVYELGDRSESEKKAISAVERLFEALGCKVVRDPKVDDPAVDRLLSVVDLVATSEERVWGVEVRGASEDERTVGWVAGAGFLSAVHAYREKRTEFAGIEPVIVLVDAKADESLHSFARHEGMRIVEIDSAQIARITAQSPKEELRGMAEQLFVREGSQVLEGVAG
jgi:hypothetical protein